MISCGSSFEAGKEQVEEGMEDTAISKPTVSWKRPWQIDKAGLRNEKLDKLASEIMANEEMKLITEAYEIVLEVNKHENSLQEDLNKKNDTAADSIKENLNNGNTKAAASEDVVDRVAERQASSENHALNLEERNSHNGNEPDAPKQDKVSPMGKNMIVIMDKKKQSDQISMGPTSSNKPRWIDQIEEDEGEKEEIVKPPVLDTSQRTHANNEGPSIASQLANLDVEKI